jgi:hypothetical protein
VLTVSIAIYCYFFTQQSKILDKSIINEIISSEEELFEDIDASAELSIGGNRRLL